MLLAVETCALVSKNTGHDWKNYNQSRLGKKKAPCFEIFGGKTTFFNVFSLWKWAKQYPGKFHADNNLPFCSTNNVVVDHHRKSVLDKHLSAVSHTKCMDDSSSKRTKQQTLKTSFKCKTPAHKEKKKVCHEWIRVCAAANIPLSLRGPSHYALRCNRCFTVPKCKTDRFRNSFIISSCIDNIYT